jgi:hypothetical protein
MSGRVSIKGQGAEIFFGDVRAGAEHPRQEPQSVQHEVKGPERIPSALEESKPVSKTTDQSASQQSSLPASKQDSKPANTPHEMSRTLSPSTRRKLRDLLEREHRTHNTYRYHDDELAAVRDIVYELEVRRGVKVSRNDIMRAALLWAIEDYNTRGAESLLLRLLKEGD